VVTEHGRPTRSRLAKIAFLIFGLGVAWYLATMGPREQHVRFVLGDASPAVVGLDIQYVSEDGELAREAQLAYGPGAAPRVVAHEPQLADGGYRIRVDIRTRDRRVSVERSVTLGGGSTQIDLSTALSRPSP
jgi:hypothetical protein